MDNRNSGGLSDRPGSTNASSLKNDVRRRHSHPVIDQWLTAANAGSVDQVCALYAQDAILLPTLSREICDRLGSIRRYFEFFLGREGFSARLIDCYVQQYSEVKIDSGIYEFKWIESGQPQVAQARFTFVIRDGLIVEHHSSLAPGP